MLEGLYVKIISLVCSWRNRFESHLRTEDKSELTARSLLLNKVNA